MKELPDSLQGHIIIDYLFTDFLSKYSRYFLSSKRANQLKKKAKLELDIFNSQHEQNQRNFLGQFVRNLEPRKYTVDGDII